MREQPEHNFALVEYGDGSTNVYLDGDDMMVNHISGDGATDGRVIGPWSHGRQRL